MNRLGRVPVYPAALAGAFVVAQFSVWWPPAIALGRPLLVVVALAIAVQLLASAVAGPHLGAMVAVVVAVAPLETRVAGILAVTMVLALGWLEIRRRRTGTRAWPLVTRSLNVIALGALAISVVSTLTAVIGLPATTTGRTMTQLAPAGAPDIYLIMLDGYPRADTLESALDFDISPWLAQMEAEGFDVAEASHSNYNRTALSVPSMLNGAFVDELLPDPPTGTVAQNRALASLINRAAAVDVARGFGYRFVHVPTDIQYLTPVADTDLRDTGQLSFFEMTLADYGIVRSVAPDLVGKWHREEHRDRILDSFQVLRALPREASEVPRLVFAHIFLPHTPIMFHADGSESVVDDCYWYECEVIAEPMPAEVRAALGEQVEFTNAQTLQLVHDIATQSERPVAIVVFSDHGLRHWMSSKAETYRNLLLARTPGQEGLFPETATPVTILPRLLNAYLGAGLPLVDENVWFTVGGENGYFPLQASAQEPNQPIRLQGG